MKIVYHKLPVSGFMVGVNTEPTFGEMEDLDNFFTNNLQIPFKATDNSGESQHVMGEFKGALVSKKADADLSVIVKSIKDLDDREMLDSKSESSALTIVRGFTIKDGKFIRSLVKDTIEEIKKN